MNELDDYGLWLVGHYGGPATRRTRWQRYAWCMRHPARAWRTRGCRI